MRGIIEYLINLLFRKSVEIHAHRATSLLLVLVFNMPEITGPLSECLTATCNFVADVRPLASMLVLMLNFIDFKSKFLVTNAARKLFLFVVNNILMSSSSVRGFILLIAPYELTLVHILALLHVQSLSKRPKI